MKNNAAESVYVFACAVALVGVSVGLARRGPENLPLPTTINDFFAPGTQPETLITPLESAQGCRFCHGDYDEAHEPFTRWAASMMGQSARDPIFHACLAIAEQDAHDVGETCLRCHAPMGWLEGRSQPTDGSALLGKDLEGVSCITCHRMVDPVFKDGLSPPADQAILAELDQIPPNPHSANYIIDPLDRRRGPFDLGQDFAWHQWLESPFHQSSNMCATCHDVSNPAFTAQPDGSYDLNELDTPHPTHDKYDQFPLERTWSEWSQSLFAQGPVDLDGRFGGNKTAVSSCQDCHMPDSSGEACASFFGPVFRDDLPQHNFNGANSWVLQAIRALYPDDVTNLTEQSVADAIARNKQMLALAADLELTAESGELTARVTNFSGHKLPTGYPEGRRMWLNLRFLDDQAQIIQEFGAYDLDTATLDKTDAKIYEAKLGLDEDMAALTGLPKGESFHFALNNTYVKDNRIPPMGFTNEGFEQVQAAPVGATYADGQHWDDTTYAIPDGAVTAHARLYHQTTTREYIEFLRDENVTNDAGQIAYDLWEQFGKSEPVLMQEASITLPLDCYADFNGDGSLDIFDFIAFQTAFQDDDPAADCNGDGTLDIFDFICFQPAFNDGCD